MSTTRRRPRLLIVKDKAAKSDLKVELTKSLASKPTAHTLPNGDVEIDLNVDWEDFREQGLKNGMREICCAGCGAEGLTRLPVKKSKRDLCPACERIEGESGSGAPVGVKEN